MNSNSELQTGRNTLVDKAILLTRRGNDLPARVRNKFHGWLDRFSRPCALQDIITDSKLDRGLSELGIPIAQHDYDGLWSLEDNLRRRSRELAQTSRPFGIFHNGTPTLGRLCYAACRALGPAIVVETGVAYGVTSAYVLQALTENGKGELHSIDLPPLGRDAEKYVGYLIPQELRRRWNLRIGSARKLLPQVFRDSGGADVFIHDSLHTYGHMKMEFAAALDSLRPGGILIADDVEGNRAFEEAVRDPRVASWFAIREKNKNAICGAMRLKAR